MPCSKDPQDNLKTGCGVAKYSMIRELMNVPLVDPAPAGAKEHLFSPTEQLKVVDLQFVSQVRPLADS